MEHSRGAITVEVLTPEEATKEAVVVTKEGAEVAKGSRAKMAQGMEAKDGIHSWRVGPGMSEDGSVT